MCPFLFARRIGVLSNYAPNASVRPFETGFLGSWQPVRIHSVVPSDGGSRAVLWQPSVWLWLVKGVGCIVLFLLPMLVGISDKRYPLPAHVCGG